MLNRTYYWLHLPTGTRGQSPFDDPCFSDSQAIRFVNELNSKQPDLWIYWL